jgi:hypothetical protein
MAANGLQVLLTARRVDRLQALSRDIESSGGSVSIFPADLAQEADRQALFDAIQSDFGGIDVLVNNAGLGWYGYYSQMPWSIIQEMLWVNVEAAIHLTRLVLPDMLRRDAGHIIHVGSIAGSFPNQGVALYSATKSLLDAFNTSLYRELHGTHVHTSILKAGPVRTEFFSSTANRLDSRAIPVERWGISAERVANKILDLLWKPHRQAYVPGWLALTPWVELVLGWLPDRLGPLLLKHRPA